MNPVDRPEIAPGQAWVPTKAGTAIRYVIEADRTSVLYKLRTHYRRRLWTWEFHDWIRRFECKLGNAP